MTGQAALPYAGTSGWTSSQASYDRVINEDSSGVTNKRQKDALHHLSLARHAGLTWRELATTLNLHHGQVSAVLSVLHKTGQIARLSDRRNRCSVYVLPNFIEDRTTENHGNVKVNRKIQAINDLVFKLWVNDEIALHAYQELKKVIDAND